MEPVNLAKNKMEKIMNIQTKGSDRDKLKVAFFVGMAILLIFLTIKIFTTPGFRVKEDTIIKEISWIDTLFMESNPTDRNIAWHQEAVPSFMEKDMKYAEEKDYDITYIYKDVYIKLNYNKEHDEWWINIHSPSNFYITGEFTIADFSIYKGDGCINIYGYDATYRKYFGKVVIDKDGADFTALTYDTNIPFDSKDKSIGSNQIGDYSLVVEENIFSFYKDGMLVSSQEFPYGMCKEVDQYNGLILNNKGQLYIAYAEMKENNPFIEFSYVGEADKILRGLRGYLKCMDEDMHINLPIIVKDGKYYVTVPEDWQVMKLLGFASNKLNTEVKNPNYSMKLVEIETAFEKASFTYTANKLWYTTVFFKFNGVEFSIDYQFGGYDDSVELPEKVSAKYQGIETDSISELWKIIEALRIEYFDYYDHEGG